MGEDRLFERLAAFTGEPIGEPRTASAPVSLAEIQRWLDAFGEDNPVYCNEAAARAAGRPTIVAPPAMMPAFTTLSLSEARARGSEGTGLHRFFAEHGFNTPGVGIAHAYEADIRVGDVISDRKFVESVSAPKATRLGTGCFVTMRTDYANQDGARVGVQRLTVIAIRGRALAAKPNREPQDPQPPEGEPIPPLSISLDRLGVIACTAAAGDFSAAHYDPDVARSRGFEDIFTDVYASCGFAQRLLNQWAGPSSRIASIDLRLGATLYPGDTLHVTGAVQERSAQQAQVALRGTCSRGVHMTGMATVLTA